MNILIKEPEPKVTVEFETKSAPCPGCRWRNERGGCDRVGGSKVTGKLLKECDEGGWTLPLVQTGAGEPR